MENGVRFAENDIELQESYKLRYKVYVEGMGRFKDKCNHELKELRDDHDDSARCIIAVKNNQAVGTIRVFWGEDKFFVQSLIDAYKLTVFLAKVEQKKICIAERLLVDESHRGSSVTLHIYKELMHFVIDHEIEAIFLDCEPHHLNSYLKLGFRPFSNIYSYPGIGLVIPMVLVSGDYAHLKAVGSPFAMLTREKELDYCLHTDEFLTLINEQDNKVVSQTSSGNEQFWKKIYDYIDIERELAPDFCNDFDELEMASILKKSHIIECAKGEQIVVGGNPTKTIFILLSGLLEVRKNDVLQAVIVPNDLMGETSYFLKCPWVADIFAVADNVKLLCIDETQISLILKHDVKLANKILMKFCLHLSEKLIRRSDENNLQPL